MLTMIKASLIMLQRLYYHIFDCDGLVHVDCTTIVLCRSMFPVASLAYLGVRPWHPLVLARKLLTSWPLIAIGNIGKHCLPLCESIYIVTTDADVRDRNCSNLWNPK